jgi:membrane protein YqaA with SNARE-associated domain
MADQLETQEITFTSGVAVRAERICKSRFGLAALSLISMVESALPVPILTDPFLAASILFNRTQTVKLVAVTTLSSVLGGIAAYFMAMYAFDWLTGFLSPDALAEFNNFTATTSAGTLALTLIGAVTPVPYTVVAWTVAVLEGSLTVFIIGSVLGRCVRYSIVGYCAYTFGPLAVQYARRYVLIASLVVVAVAALLVWYKM